MSAAHDGHADHHDAGHHDASDHDHFDNEPVKELGADEPRTPGWIPVLGLALFFTAGTAFLLMGGDDDADKANAEQAPAAVQPAAPQPPPPNPAQQPGAQQPRAVPNPAGSAGALRQLTPEQAQAIQKQLDAMRARQQQGAQPPAPGAQ